MARQLVSPVPSRAGHVVLRVFAIVLGAYGVTSALVAGAVRLLRLAGVNPSDAFTVSSIMGLLLYMSLALWAAAAPRLGSLYAWFVSLSVLGLGTAWAVGLLLGKAG